MFPMTVTVHNQAQLNAILATMSTAMAAHPAPEPSTSELVQITQARKDAAAPAPKSAKASPAPTSPTATEAAVGAQEKTADASGQSAGNAGAEQQVSTAATEPVSYDRVAKAITDKAKTNREHVLATLAKFGAKKGPELKTEQYADFLAELG